MATITRDLQEREHVVSGYIDSYADIFELDPNLIRALITQESRFVAEATSPTGAYGYGQFTGIGAKQVQNIAAINSEAADLHFFTKRDASDPDKGIKAICATLWWLFNKKYPNVEDKKIQLEAVLTFYNAGGIAAKAVIDAGGHEKALAQLQNISQAASYAPSVAQWYIAWHELKKKQEPVSENPFDAQARKLPPVYVALIDSLRCLPQGDPTVDVIIDSRNGMTEVSIIFPGELDVSN